MRTYRLTILGALELVAVFLAFAALLVSYASLHLATLRQADVQVEYVDTGEPVVRGPSFSGPVLGNSQTIVVRVFVVNVGARGCFLQSVELADLVNHGALPALWTTIRPAPDNSLPVALEASDVETLLIRGELQGDAINNPEDGAERIRGLTTLGVTVRWSFLRSRGPISTLVSKRHSPSKRITREFVLELDAQHYRGEVLAHWRHRKEWHSILQIAEPG